MPGAGARGRACSHTRKSTMRSSSGSSKTSSARRTCGSCWIGLEAARVSLVFPPLSAGGGLGALTPDTFEPLFERRRALTAADIADARALWRAYAAPEPLSLTRLQPTLPFAPAAVGLHCARFPSVVDGLDDVEHATLGALDDPLAFGALFRRVTRSAELSELAVGDVQFAAIVRDLAAGGTPLLAIEHRDRPFADWRVWRTSPGAGLLAGRADRLALVPLDRWLGGVHLRPGAPLWRWDRERHTLVAAGAWRAGRLRRPAILDDAPGKLGRSPAL